MIESAKQAVIKAYSDALNSWFNKKFLSLNSEQKFKKLLTFTDSEFVHIEFSSGDIDNYLAIIFKYKPIKIEKVMSNEKGLIELIDWVFSMLICELNRHLPSQINNQDFLDFIEKELLND